MTEFAPWDCQILTPNSLAPLSASPSESDTKRKKKLLNFVDSFPYFSILYFCQEKGLYTLYILFLFKHCCHKKLHIQSKTNQTKPFGLGFLNPYPSKLRPDLPIILVRKKRTLELVLPSICYLLFWLVDYCITSRPNKVLNLVNGTGL